MTTPSNKPLAPSDTRALIAVDLGAESCRVCLLRWKDGRPSIQVVHRIPNNPREIDGGLHWDLKAITGGLEEGLRKCAALAPEGIRSIAADGWAVDYARIDANGAPLADPFCYRDPRNVESQNSAHRLCSQERMRELTGIQILPFNTAYQLHADAMAGLPEGQQWLNLPEYLLAHWGGARVSEYTNATHTELVELYTKQWCPEIFSALHLNLNHAPRIVPPGTDLGKLSGPLAKLPALRDTTLIAPACHDTASAIAGIPATGNDWAYISSGTWSLVGALIEQPRNGAAAQAENFTNLGAVGGRVCFHKNVNGMWLISQCMAQWALDGKTWPIVDLVAAAEKTPCPIGLLDVDDPDLLLPEHMPQRINAQRVRQRPCAARRVSLQRARLRQPHLPFAGRALRPGPEPRRLPHRQKAEAALHRRRRQSERIPQSPHIGGHRPGGLPRIAGKLHRRQLRRAACHARRRPRQRHRRLRRTGRTLGRPLHRGPRPGLNQRKFLVAGGSGNDSGQFNGESKRLFRISHRKWLEGILPA